MITRWRKVGHSRQCGAAQLSVFVSTPMTVRLLKCSEMFHKRAKKSCTFMLYSSLGETFISYRDKNTPSGAYEAKQTPPSLVLHKQLDEQTLMTTPSASLKGQRAAARFQVNEGICVSPAGALLGRHCRRGLDPVYTVWVCVVVGLLLD